MFASGKFAIAECDRCGFRYKLTALKKLTIKTKNVSIKVCKECWEMDQPQLQLGMYPVNDPQAVREPRRDNSYYQSGYTGLDILVNGGEGILANGTPSGGSRVFQWGWAPVGMRYDFNETQNDLKAKGNVVQVTIS
jgi:peptidoglycan hydrolase-like protein with peptidoglycan-binding domain